MLTLCAAAQAPADQATNEIESLRKQIQALSQKIDELEQKQGAEMEKVTAAPFITAGETGFSMKSANSNFILNLGGFAQVDARDYESPAIGAKDTFTIRRMRAIASGTVYHYFDYFMQVDFASGVTSTATNDAFLQDAYVNIHPMKAIQVQAGKFKEPLSLEILPLDQFLWFLERGFPTESPEPRRGRGGPRGAFGTARCLTPPECLTACRMATATPQAMTWRFRTTTRTRWRVSSRFPCAIRRSTR